MSRVLLQPSVILIVDVVHLALANENVFTTALDACQRTIAIRHFRVAVCMLSCLLTVVSAAHTVADLTGPCLIGGKGVSSAQSEHIYTLRACLIKTECCRDKTLHVFEVISFSDENRREAGISGRSTHSFDVRAPGRTTPRACFTEIIGWRSSRRCSFYSLTETTLPGPQARRRGSVN